MALPVRVTLNISGKQITGVVLGQGVGGPENFDCVYFGDAEPCTKIDNVPKGTTSGTWQPFED